MKFKYFLRGLGAGIIFASLVCFTAYRGNLPAVMSDEEIIERAKGLGMVEKEDQLESLLSTESKKEDTTEEDTDKEETSEENSDGTSGEVTEEATGETSEEVSEETSEEITEEQVMSQETSTEDLEETITITVEGGISSFTVCQQMQRSGLIEDAWEFDAYLIENGYAGRLRVGSHTLKKGMSFRELADAISW